LKNRDFRYGEIWGFEGQGRELGEFFQVHIGLTPFRLDETPLGRHKPSLARSFPRYAGIVVFMLQP
jgi:hypothetical protein